MPKVTIEEKDKNVVKLTFNVSKDEIQPHLEEAAQKISSQSSIPGFRPGKAGYDIVKQRVGEMKILEEALELIVRKSFVEAVLENNIETIGSPKIDVEKLAPDNDIVFTAEVTRMPRVKSVAKLDSLSIEAKEVKVEDKDIDQALVDLQRMQTKEVRLTDTKKGITEESKVVVSMNMKKEGVPVEGGQADNHAIFLQEDYYIPGLKEKLIGMKEGEDKTFTIKFPKENVQKFLAGADVEIEIKLKEIYTLEVPELTDEFAKSINATDMKTLKDLIKANLKKEKDYEELGRQEKEVLEMVATKSQFDEIPDLLLNQEIEKMIQELKHRIEEQGLEFDAYIQSLKKTLAQIKLDFTTQALVRIKVAIVMQYIAKKEKIVVSSEELDKELDMIAERYEDKDTKAQIYAPEYREYTEHILSNRKVITFLKEKVIKK
jgi:trigger factor